MSSTTISQNYGIDRVFIELHRGKTGLGFNIRGGSDARHLPSDPGIFVAKIRAEGAAGEDGRLQEGDKILEINGNDVVDVTHAEAVRYFLNAGDSVRLTVLPGAEKVIKELNRQKQNGTGGNLDDQGNPGSSFPWKLFVIGGIVLAAAVVIRQRLK